MQVLQAPIVLAELAGEVHHGGGRVLLGACFEDIDEPYGPFAQAIAADVALTHRPEALQRAGEAHSVLAQLSPEIGAALGANAADPRGAATGSTG